MNFLKNVFRPDKWSLGTVFDAAGTIGGLATGGFNPLKLGGDLSKGLSLAGGLLGSNSSGNVPGTYTPGSEEELLSQLGQGNLRFQLANQPKQQQSILGAIGAIDPRNDATNARYVQNQLMAGADRTGRMNANNLSRRGYGSGVADAAMLDARNNATEQGNEYFMNLRSPANLANRYAGMADLYGGESYGNTLSGRLSLQANANNQRMQDLKYYYDRPASGMESFAGILGQIGPYLENNKKSGSLSEIDKYRAANLGNAAGKSLASAFLG